MNAENSVIWKLLLCAAVLGSALLGAFGMLSGAQAMGERLVALKVGLVADRPDVMDGSFNQMAYEGLLQAQTELGVQGTVYTSTDIPEIEANIEQCVIDENELCLAVSFLATDAISQSAKTHPGTKFAIIDISYMDYPDNLQGMSFAAEEAGYLAGTLAGKMTDSNVLGLIGGWEIPAVDAFLDGYAQGATCANSEVTTIISYTNDFAAPELGADYAQAMLSQGADVIFAAAGVTGSGAILTATQSGAWAVGVDSDQYLSVFEGGSVPGADHLLTSAMKRIDNAVFQVVSETMAGNFISGTVIYDLARDGVGLAPYHAADVSISAEAKAAVDLARSRLIDGTIDPYGPCPEDSYTVYLPLTLRLYAEAPPSWKLNPSPTNTDLEAMDFVDADNGWAVGAGGVILRWDGASWANFTSPVANDLNGIDMLDVGSGLAVGDEGAILRWDGAQWTSAASPVSSHLKDVQFIAANDAWAVGDSGVIVHWDGASWSDMPSPTNYDLFALDFLSATDGWGVGGAWNAGIGWYEAAYIHWNGSSWSNYTPVHVLDLLYDVDMVSTDFAISVGINNAKSFWNGFGWDSSYSVPSMGIYSGVDFLSSNDGWAVGWMYQESNIQHWAGSASGWSRVTSPVDTALNDVYMLDANNGWAVGEVGVILRYGR